MLSLPGYKIVKKLAEGTSSQMYRAQRVADNLPVILKVLKHIPSHLEDVQHYKQDFDIRQALNVEWIVKPYSLETFQERLVMVVEYFGGESLKTVMRKHRFSLEDRLGLAIQITELVGKLHQHHIIHKDIKPSNFILNTTTRQLKITDFGIATRLTRETPGTSPPTMLVGTLAYISPEQTGRVNRSVDSRSDLYSLGVTLYEWFAGHLPFESTDPMELIHCHIAKLPAPLHTIKSDIPPILSEIVRKLLSKAAEDRYQTAAGLKADLERCYQELRKTGYIESFPLGTSDRSEEFHIPEKLYGREHEIQDVKAMFDRVTQDRSEILFCRGEPGIGKTALIDEMRQSVGQHQGYFVRGKYDVFKRSIPYTGIIQAFQELIEQFLAEPEERLQVWRTRILERVGKNGQLITDVIPEVELIIGQQPNVPSLPPVESQNRFNMIFQSFVRSVASPAHPLVAFFDDLQWADRSSLQLLEVLFSDPELHYVFFIGAYRDTEVDSGHPLSALLEQMRKQGVRWEHIALKPLSPEAICRMLGDTLRCPAEEVLVLAELVYAKTSGNPFFTREFLHTLYREQLLSFEHGWTYNLEQIQEAGITDNVIELMAAKIRQLPVHTWQVLKLAACLGFEFDMNVLASVCGKNEENVFKELKDAFDAGIIIKVADEARFVHDKVSEAAHSLIGEQERQVLHYRIAKTLLSQEEHYAEQIFSIADQLNFAKPLLTEAERTLAITFNIEASKKAKAAAAYRAAATFLKYAAEMLPENAWETEYRLTLTLYTEWAEAAYMATRYQEAEKLFETVLHHATSLYDTLKIYQIMILYHENKREFREGVQLAVHVLNRMGIAFLHPDEIDQQAVMRQMERLQHNLKTTDITNVMSLPEMHDPNILAATGILFSVIVPLWNTYPDALSYMLLEMVNLSLEYGVCPASASGFSALGAILCVEFYQVDLGYQFGEVALKIPQRFHDRFFECTTIFSFYNTIHFWKKPLKWGKENLIQAYYIGVETGNLAWAAYCLNHYCLRALLTGEGLEQAKKDYDKYTLPQLRLRQESPLTFYNPPKQTVYNLTGQAKDVCKLVGEAFDEDEMLPKFFETKQYSAIGLTYTCKLLLYCVFGEYHNALPILRAEHTEVCIRASGTGHYQSYFGLCLFAVSMLQNCSSLPRKEQQEFLSKATAIQEELHRCAQSCPINFTHLYLLVSAEIARVSDDEPTAITLYNQAIASAQEHEFLHITALANELAAKFWEQRGNHRYAKAHLTDAYHTYQLWGCTPKVQQLKTEYSEFLSLIVAQTTTETRLREFDRFDIDTIMKAARTLSEEIDLEHLLSKMMRIILENAGAQRGFLVLEQHEQLLIEATALVVEDELNIEVLQTRPLGQHLVLSEGIVWYVLRTGEAVVLADAARSQQFKQDSYILKHHPKSLLCTPIRYKDHITGVVYLENNFASNVFTEERVEMLNVLLPHAAISLENARLFAERQQAEEALRESEARFRRLTENAKDMIYRMSLPDGKYEYISPASTSLFGYSPEDWYKTPKLIQKVIHPDWLEYFAELWEKLVKGDMPPFYEYQIIHKSGEMKWVNQRNVLIRDDKGTPIAIEGIVTDITERKQAEEEIRILNAELEQRVQQRTRDLEAANKELKDFAYVVSHDLKAPLRGISRLAQWLVKDYSEAFDEQGKEMVELLVGRVKRMDNLIEGILAYSRIGRIIGEAESIDLNIVVNEVVDMLTPPEFIHITVETRLPVVIADKIRIVQVFQNLFGNALKFMDKPEGNISIGCVDEGSHWTFKVADNGPGIDAKYHEKIFQIFQTLVPRDEEENTGVGLAIVKKIVEFYGGKIWVESTVGKGSVFSFTFPK